MALPQIVYVRPGPAMLISSLHFLAIIFVVGLAARIVPIWTVELPAGALAIPFALAACMVVRTTYSANDAWWLIVFAAGFVTLAALLTSPVSALPSAPGFEHQGPTLHWWDLLAIGFGYVFGEMCSAGVWNYARRNSWGQFPRNFFPVLAGQLGIVMSTWPVLFIGHVPDNRIAGLLFARVMFAVASSAAMAILIAWASIHLHRYHYPEESD